MRSIGGYKKPTPNPSLGRGEKKPHPLTPLRRERGVERDRLRDDKGMDKGIDKEIV